MYKQLVKTKEKRAVFGWVMFDWAAQPYFTLVTTFFFGPYFVASLAPDPVTGQAWWGYATSAAGLTIAFLSPVLGAISDVTGPRKPWILFFSTLLVLASAALWFTEPGVPGSIGIALVAFAIGLIGVEFATVFTNAMMPSLVPPERLGRLSGLGWATGFAGGLICLFIVLAFFTSSAETGQTMLGFAPWFGLDPETFEDARATGPFSAVWYLIFIIPLLLFTPDTERNLSLPGLRFALRTGLVDLRTTLSEIDSHQNIVRFLITRMIYADGLVALFAFGGVYAASVFGWGITELGMFGILLTITGLIGSLIGGRLDDIIGPKPVIQIALVILVLSTLAVLSVDRDTIFFVIPVDGDAVAGSGPFSTLPEKVYMGLGAIIGFAAGPVQAASRTLLVRLAPREKMTQFFGLFALSGKVTSFAGPMLVGLVTAFSGSQRVGISVVLAFFVAGIVGLVLVEVPTTET